MNLINIPDKVTVRLDQADKLNLKAIIESTRGSGLEFTTADAFRVAATREAKRLSPPTAAAKKATRR